MGKQPPQGRSRGKPARAGARGARRRTLLRALLRGAFVGSVWLLFLLLSLTAWLAYDLPEVEKLWRIERRPSVTLLAADGSMLASFGDLYGEPVRLRDLPPYLPQAVLATEDRRFYSHYGIDPLRVARAIYVNIRDGELVQGGSTITQQLAKNVFLGPERTLRRKGQEVLLALWLEHNLTKEEILTLYLNRVYLGAGTFGVDAAARKYFGKPATEVTAYEAAMLTGILKAPSRFNPLADRTAADARARLVLRNMVRADYLSEAEAAHIAGSGAAYIQAVPALALGRHFADWILDQVTSYVGSSERDLVVLTTLDRRLQRLAEAELRRILEAEGPAHGASQAALVAMERDGRVRAMVGGHDYRQSQFNRAAQALRQPGSAFKAFVFLAGFERGLRPDDRFPDAPIRVAEWQPGNYEGRYYGEVTLREAFARSLNSVAVRVWQRVGSAAVIDAARRLGITTPLTRDASIALGSSEVTLLELTAAYGSFANEGVAVWPSGIEEIRDSAGELLYRRAGSGPGRVVAARQVAQMLDVMNATVQWGTGRSAALDRPAVGKTGTSQDFRDAWFIGLTADLIAGVWVGNDDNRAMNKVSGGTLPARIWKAFMEDALEGLPPRPLGQPGAELVATAPAADANLFQALIQTIIKGSAAPAAERAPAADVTRNRRGGER